MCIIVLATAAFRRKDCIDFPTSPDLLVEWVGEFSSWQV